MPKPESDTTICLRCGTSVIGDNLHTCTPKITPRYTPTIMSGAVVRWGEYPQISASRDAVRIHDTWEFRSLEDYEKFSELLKAAMSLHIDMKHSHDPHEVAKRFCNE